MKATPVLPISTTPFLHDRVSTPKIMFELVVTLLPVFAVSIYYFGLAAFLVMLSAVAGCLVTEWGFSGSPKVTSLRDGSALLTGMLLALTLPPGFPLWMAFLGGVVAIGMGKTIWGGLGQNVFNPALLGRAFLQAAFPTAITTWEAPDGQYLAVRGANLAPPLYQSNEVIDGYSGATALSKMKFEQEPTEIMDLLMGNVSGSLGETCGILLLLAAVYLIFRRIINWHIPASILLTVAVFSGILYLIDPDQYGSPGFMLLAGGLLLGAVYMATDPVTSPLTVKGCWIYGIGIGILVVLIRVWGGLPEGVMYAILLMNAGTPLINRFVKTRVYGH